MLSQAGVVIMKVIAINGSPRKKWNTAMLLEKALEGAASQGAETELVHLYDLTYQGCISCFTCKKKGGKSYGRCAVVDALTPLYARIREVDGLILGSPIYFGDMTGQMRAFLERLVFPYLVYSNDPQTLFPRRITVALIYTMGAPEEMARQVGYDRLFSLNEMFMQRTFGPTQSLMSYDTLQFDDYSKYVAPRFDPKAKAERRRTVFQEDCGKAFELGARLAKPGT
jgi:multimeric flavodoxin WrbA